ncbi:rhodanese-like domain-containing protein [Weeksellaceae bacterium A-14]|uniref:rhodanese-like domain-containing protein n=1 Tax=Daejeonia sp. YH14 TaxID=3439042 RepID=UPI0031E4D037
MSLIDVLKSGKYKLVDVREPLELEMDGFIKGAVNIPLGEIADHKDELLNADVPVVLYCRSGNRSGKALEYLITQGLQNGYNGGGYQDLKETLENL